MAAKVVHEEEFSFVSWGCFYVNVDRSYGFYVPLFTVFHASWFQFWFREGLRRVVAAGGGGGLISDADQFKW